MVGTPVAFLTSEHFWQGQHFVWFMTPLKALIEALRLGPGGLTFVPSAMAGAALIVGLVGIWLLDRMGRSEVAAPAGALAGTRRISIPASWWVYTIGALLVAYSAYFSDSIPRYTMAAFPVFVAFAWVLPRKVDAVVVGVMACLQGALLIAVLSVAVHPVLVPLVP
jgi:hypothetical protein